MCIACNIGGMTIHSWSGIGIGSNTVEKTISMIKANRRALKRWRDTDILVIDEVSMLSDKLFEFISCFY